MSSLKLAKQNYIRNIYLYKQIELQAAFPSYSRSQNKTRSKIRFQNSAKLSMEILMEILKPLSHLRYQSELIEVEANLKTSINTKRSKEEAEKNKKTKFFKSFFRFLRADRVS